MAISPAINGCFGFAISSALPSVLPRAAEAKRHCARRRLELPYRRRLGYAAIDQRSCPKWEDVRIMGSAKKS
jgi:hypothetical protein